MHKYDTTMKDILFDWPNTLIQAVAGSGVKAWRNVELPRVNAPRADLIAWLENGALLHLELQSYHEPEMAWQMLVRGGLIRLAEGVKPRQVLVWVGDPPSSMANRIREDGLEYEFRLVDIREFDAEDFLSTGYMGDAVLAILCRTPDRTRVIRAILDRICDMPVVKRAPAIERLLILSGLRHCEEQVREEVTNMPVIIDIMDNKVLREPYIRGLAEGEARGLAEGEAKGEARGQARQARTLLAQVRRKFGEIPPGAVARIEGATPDEIDDWALRLLDAGSLEQLFADGR